MSEQEKSTDTSPFADNVDKFVVDPDAGAEESTKQADQIDESSMSKAEIQARKGGWVPQGEFDGDSDDWVSAKVFNERGELYDTLRKQNKSIGYLEKQVKSTNKALKVLGEHNKKIGAAEYEKAVETLKQQKVALMEAGEYGAVVDLDDKIAEAKQNKISAENDTSETDELDTTEALEPPQQWTDYEADNDWYGKNRVMTNVANDLVIGYLQDQGIQGKPSDRQIDECIAFMDQEMRDAFPHKFSSEERTETTTTVKPKSRTSNRTIETGDEVNPNRTTKGKSTKSKYTVNHLSDEQKAIAKTLINSGAFDDMQTYVDQLAEVGGIEGQ